MRERHVLTEEELRERKLRRYKDTAVKVGKGVGKVALGLAKVPIDVLNYLGRQGQKPKGRGRGAVPDMSIDLGLNKDQRKHQRELNETLSRARKIKVKRRRASQNRFG